MFSDYSLELEYGDAVETGDMEAAEAFEERVIASKRYKPDALNELVMRKLTGPEIQSMSAAAQGVLVTLKQSGVKEGSNATLQ